jgi:cobyric acid synthase
MTARTLMVQGTASSVGKSLMVAALCRILRDRGLRVAPFKSQNMALNSAVTADGHEIGRAQAVQARAAGVEPTVHMNPILLKPETDMRAQVVLRGKPVGSMRFGEYHERRPELVTAIRESLATLRAAHDVVVIEGAGSPAEINLKDRDIVNGFVAEMADAPVLLVGDIDRGGVFASLYGTVALLDDAERARIRGFIINKFRGEYDILAPALPMIEARLGLPVLGVVPFLHELRLPEEDGMSLEDRTIGASEAHQLEVAVVALPHLSNFDAGKVTKRVEAKTSTSTFLGPEGIQVEGYFIHMGRAEGAAGREAFELTGRLDGAVAEGGAVVGTMIHGIFDSAPLVDGLVRALLAANSLHPGGLDLVGPDSDAEYDRLARSVHDAVDMERIIEMMGPGR